MASRLSDSIPPRIAALARQNQRIDYAFEATNSIKVEKEDSHFEHSPPLAGSVFGQTTEVNTASAKLNPFRIQELLGRGSYRLRVDNGLAGQHQCPVFQ